MEYRTAWVACVLAATALGIGGMSAEGCGGDDTAATPPPTGAGGSAGSGGSASGGKGGAAGTAGSGGATAGSAGSAGTAGSGGRGDSGAVDARPDVDYRAVCLSASDAGSSCLNTCICENCGMQAVACFSDAPCRRLVDCANANGCTDTACALQKCPTELAEAGVSGVVEAQALATCVNMAMCYPKCSDAASDARATSDAPATTDTSVDAPAVTDTSTSDAPAE